MIGGLYGWAAIGLVVAGLSGYGAYQKQRAEAATSRQEMAEGQRDRAIQLVKESEATVQAMRKANKWLNDAIDIRDKRAKELEAAKRKLKGELDEIKKTVPPEDQSCMDRPMPPAILDRLRNG